MKKSIKSSIVTLLCMAVAAPVFAQKNVLEEIIVTARKKTELEQETPISLTVLSAREIENLFPTDLRDLSDAAPNVILQPSGYFQNTTSFYMRGIGAGDVDSAQDPAVVVVLDGIPMGRNATNMLDVFDLESVEILRGPQGTLFGRNAVGGVVNVRTRRPTGDFGLRAQVTAGEYGRLDLRASIDFPMGDDWAGKITALSQNFDGFYENTSTGSDAGGDDLLVVKPMVVYTPSEDFELTFIGEFQRDRGDIYPATNASETHFLAGPFGRPGHDLGEGDDFAWSADAPNKNRVDTDAITIEMNWETAYGQWTSLTGYRDTEEFAWTDLDATDIPFFNTVRPINHDQFTQELRFSRDVTETVFLQAGLYYFNQEFDMAQQRDQLFIPGVPSTYGFTAQEQTSYAIFFHADVALSEELNLTLGGRYTTEEKDFTHNPLGTCPGPGPENCPPPFEVDESWSNFSPKLGLDYALNENVMIYAVASRGYRSGGFAGRAVSLSTIGPFDEEVLDAYELGVKSDLMEGRLRLNLSAFYYEFDDLQRSIVRQSTSGPGNETIVDNAASANMYGFEIELKSQVTDRLRITASLGYLDSSYDEFMADLNGDGIETDNSDLELQLNPEVQARIAASYEFSVYSDAFLSLNADYAYSDEMWLSPANTAFAERDSTNVFNASITFRTSDDRFRVSAFGKNLTDDIYKLGALEVGPLSRSYVPNYPRHYGVEVAYEL